MAELTREIAEAVSSLVRTVRPSWRHDDVMAVLAEIHGRDDLPGIVRRLVHVASLPEAASPSYVLVTWGRQPPRIRPDEFAPSEPAPPERRAALIAQARASIRTPEETTP